MTAITNLIPGLRGNGSRRAVDEVDRLRQDVASLLNFKAAADDYFALLTQDRDDVYAAWTWAEQARQEAETVASCAQTERDEWRDEALALRARFGPQLAAEANAHRVDVPPMVRDTSDPADQATGPIDVRDLRERFADGPVVTLHHSPMASDPAHVPSWAVCDEPEPST